MRILGNVLWFLFGGLFAGISWFLAGCLWCITIIGIPWGIQCFKFAELGIFPFGKEIIFGGGPGSCLLNLLWLLLSGLPLAIGFFLWGCILCITIVGVPFGKQMFKLAQLAFMPFGSQIIEL